MKCLVIDDEPLALQQMSLYISKIPSLELVKLCSSAREAIEVLSKQDVDLIFTDISMPDISGVEFVRSLQTAPMVIFTTAYDEYAVEGFRLDAVDYLLKPFSFEELSKAVGKASSLFELMKLRDSKSQDDAFETVEEQNVTVEETDYISVKADYKVSLVRYADIVYMESVGEYVRLHLVNGSSITTLFRLKNMESQLPAKKFMRIHRSYIINLAYVTAFTKVKVYMDNRVDLPVGGNYRDIFLKVIQAIKGGTDHNVEMK